MKEIGSYANVASEGRQLRSRTKVQLDKLPGTDSSSTNKNVNQTSKSYKNQVTIGVNNKLSFKGVEKTAWLYLGKVNEDVNSEIILNYLKEDDSSWKFTCRQLITKGNSNSFLIGAPMNLKEKLMDPHYWPENVIVKRFWFPKNKKVNFLEKTTD